MRRLFLLPLLFGCATAESSVTPGVPPAPTRIATVQRAPSPFDARDWATEFATPADCERAARELQHTDRDRAWAALRGCVERARWPRGQFTSLHLIVNGAWDEDLHTRPDAPRLVAQVIALRGGDVDGDLPSIQKSRVAIFALAAAMRQPDVYKGRFVLLRANLSDLKSDRGIHTALLHESTLHGSTREFETGPKTRTSGNVSGSYRADLNTSRFGTVQGTVSENYNYRGESVAIGRRFENEKVATGRTALGRIPQPDPFLEPDRDFIFLARFDGVRPGGEDQPSLALVTLVTYFAPAPLLME